MPDEGHATYYSQLTRCTKLE